MAEHEQHPAPAGAEAAPNGEAAGEGKALKRTYVEFREEARRAILSSHDREKYEALEPEERDFVDSACLYEFNSQQVSQQKRRIKLRDMLLARDVAAAYCPSRDAAGQYSEGMRILKNSESGSDTVKFVLGRRVCTMLEKICNIYGQHPRTFVSADLHRMETELLNYISRLGRLIREPLGEARRIYGKLKERTGWEIPATAFGMAEDCEVPQLFFNRYTDSSQLLLKDPQKPFRSDTLNPPLKLDFRIKNAVLILAGENRFHIDRKKFQNVQDTPAARAIMANSLEDEKKKIGEAYRRNPHQLAERLTAQDEIGVRTIKENAFAFFYGYTLKHLPNTAARMDAAELFLQGLMPEENDIGCRGFCRWLYAPDAVRDDPNPDYWLPNGTLAYRLRKTFHDLGTGKDRLSMFATRMNKLLTDYLDEQLKRIRTEQEKPFTVGIAQAEARLKQFIALNAEAFARAGESGGQVEEVHRECSLKLDQALELVNRSFNKSLSAATEQEKRELVARLRPKLEEEAGKRGATLAELKARHQALVERYNTIVRQLQRLDQLGELPADPVERQRLLASFGAAAAGETPPAGRDELRGRLQQELERVKLEVQKLKAQHAAVLAVEKSLLAILDTIRESDSCGERIAALEREGESQTGLAEQRRALENAMEQLRAERDEVTGRTEDEIETNLET